MITKIISGGQIGADRGILDAFINCHLPSGRLTEDGSITLNNELKEMGSKNYLNRTEANVIACR